ncbi:MAG: hypothetical protein GY805_37060, partial [Chloroflexi bacterium]|nr:hypothetical protein [Chloroflexota bacterium]
ALMDISALPNISSVQLADRLLDAGVSLLSGGVFGKYGEQYVRLAYVVSQERLAEALERIKSWWFEGNFRNTHVMQYEFKQKEQS